MVFDLANNTELFKQRPVLHRNEMRSNAFQAAEFGLRSIVQTDFRGIKKQRLSGLLLTLFNIEGELQMPTGIEAVDSFLTKIGELYKMALDERLYIDRMEEVVKYYSKYQTPSTGRRRM